MENIFGNIQLIPVDFHLNDPIPPKKLPDPPKPKQSKPTAPRPIDYQQTKRRTECIKEIQQLKTNIKQTQQKNLHLYNTILSLAPDFAYVLFHSKNYQNQNYGNLQNVKLLGQKLMSDLDKLYEENCFLEKQINRVKFDQHTEQIVKEEKFRKSINHYQFLRNVWQPENQTQKFCGNQKEESKKCQDLIEKLNKKVATVRFKINHLLKQEQSNNNINSLNSQIQNDFILKSCQYQKLLRQFQQALMEKEDQRSRFWNELENKRQPLDMQKQQQTVQIQNLKSKLKEMEVKHYESQREIICLKEQILKKDEQLTKLKNNEKNLFYIFSEKNEVSNSTGFCIHAYNFAQENPSKIQHHTLSSKFTQLIQTLKNHATLAKQTVLQNFSLDFHLQNSSLDENQKSISSRKSLNEINLNKISSDRMSLIKKTNKLDETLSASNTLRRNSSRDKENELRICKTIFQQKQNIDSRTFIIERYKDQLLLDFRTEMTSKNMQAELKGKFVRTANKNRRQNLR